MALPQHAFDSAEDIGLALHMLDGMIQILERELIAVDLGETECRVWPVIGALRYYRNEADRAATSIARSGAQVV
ncbi:hypothetical protein [Pararhodobacter sp.]|uniref:hypothetical protein n=1 Tax=Pararhodobacter sp. TaxID=2127056 RepID=UPI002FDD8300